MTGLTFDDVLITPVYSTIDSRDEINITQEFLGTTLNVPIVSSPMNCVTGPEMVTAMVSNGGMGFLHRFADISTQSRWMDELLNIPTRIVSVGLREIYPTILEKASIVNIDTAHGDRKQVIDLIKYIKKVYPQLKIVAGNVATGWGFEALAAAGADAVRVGIGPGAACITRTTTGIGVPQFTAIKNATNMRTYYKHVKIIADGGIRNSGDMVKALAAGADAVMLGKVLASTKEACGTTWSDGHDTYRLYQGQSMLGSNGERKAPEGTEQWVMINTTVQEVMTSWSNYLRSGMSYVGARSLNELKENAQFIEVTPNSLKESGARYG